MCGYKPCGQRPHSFSLTVFCCGWRGGGGRDGEAGRYHPRLDGLAPWEPLARSGRPTHSTAPQARIDLPHPSFCSRQGRPGGPSAPHIPHSLCREPVLPPQPPTASHPGARRPSIGSGLPGPGLQTHEPGLGLQASCHSLSYLGQVPSPLCASVSLYKAQIITMLLRRTITRIK